MTYEFWCKECDFILEEFRTVANCKKPGICPKCGKESGRIISGGQGANTGKGFRIPGVCHTLPGKSVFVKNKHHFRELCKEHGLYPAGV